MLSDEDRAEIAEAVAAAVAEAFAAGAAEQAVADEVAAGEAGETADTVEVIENADQAVIAEITIEATDDVIEAVEDENPALSGSGDGEIDELGDLGPLVVAPDPVAEGLDLGGFAGVEPVIADAPPVREHPYWRPLRRK